MPRRKVVAPTIRQLVDKIAKNEGKTRNDYTSLLAMEQDLIPNYDISSDYERNQFVAMRLDEPREVKDDTHRSVFGETHKKLS